MPKKLLSMKLSCTFWRIQVGSEKISRNFWDTPTIRPNTKKLNIKGDIYKKTDTPTIVVRKF